MPAQPIVLLTDDGSSTVAAGELTYHSLHGAIQESQHVFIKAGFEAAAKNRPGNVTLSILEMGFGTGLNALLTLLAGAANGARIHYTSVEKFQLPRAVWKQLNYGEQPGAGDFFNRLHNATWNEDVAITPAFTLRKINGDLQDFLAHDPGEKYGLVYYDAFAPDDQPELWTPEIFAWLAAVMVQGGILTTYCAKGQVRRNMLAAGLQVERIPGPPGKREMMRASKP